MVNQVKYKTARKALGIDFGGTAIKIGLVDETGRVLEERRFATADFSSPSKWLGLIGRHVADCAAKKQKLAGIGVGVPGFTDFARGFIYNLTNVPGWTSVPLAEIMRKKFGRPVYVDNDVNAMALGEHLHGAGKGLRHVFFATLGTGVGGALVINGRLYRGAYSMAGEIGHVSINRNGRKTREGRGGLETYVGNRQIVKYVRSALRRGKKSMIASLVKNDPRQITPKTIAHAAARGDHLALEIMDKIADCLATAFASVTYLLQPEAIIVGGGVAESGAVLFNPLRRHLAERLHKYFAARIRIIPAVLGPKAGMIGCAALVFQNDPQKTRRNRR